MIEGHGRFLDPHTVAVTGRARPGAPPCPGRGHRHRHGFAAEPAHRHPFRWGDRLRQQHHPPPDPRPRVDDHPRRRRRRCRIC
ncbi:MAG: hypothetical protein M0C28_22890 [Candidatus Moduliflexus flocculans]|nr:hypothetical protein [Candidatus Moduliflexus flocculans]